MKLYIIKYYCDSCESFFLFDEKDIIPVCEYCGEVNNVHKLGASEMLTNTRMKEKEELNERRKKRIAETD